MANEEIVVQVGGERYDSWVRSTVRAAYHEACRSFELIIAAEYGTAATHALFAPGTPLQIFASGDLLFDGFVNRRRPRFGAKEAYMTIEGRSKGQDHVDSTAMHKSGSFEKKDPVEIGNAIGEFGSKFTTDRTLDKIERYQLSPGETVYDCVQDLCRNQGMTLCGQPNGDILITDASQSKRHAGLLDEACLFEGEANFSDENRHSATHVRGQRQRGHGKSALRQHVVATDSTVRRNRPHVHHHHGDASDGHLRKRAADKRNRSAGRGIHAGGQVPWWRDQGGTLWTPGWTIFTQHEFLGLAQDMLIEAVDFVATAEGGTDARLGLVDPQAYGGKAGKASASGSEWGMDASAAQ